MLDKPEKTHALLSALRSALPFEIELTADVLAHIAPQTDSKDIRARQVATDVSYAGDEVGILCHIQREDTANVFIISLTHLRLHHPLPLAAAVANYQKHLIKKMKKQGLY